MLGAYSECARSMLGAAVERVRVFFVGVPFGAYFTRNGHRRDICKSFTSRLCTKGWPTKSQSWLYFTGFISRLRRLYLRGVVPIQMETWNGVPPFEMGTSNDVATNQMGPQIVCHPLKWESQMRCHPFKWKSEMRCHPYKLESEMRCYPLKWGPQMTCRPSNGGLKWCGVELRGGFKWLGVQMVIKNDVAPIQTGNLLSGVKHSFGPR